MPVVNVKGKKYGVGYEWLTYSSEEEAKEKVKFLKRRGYFANMVKVRKGLYQVYYIERADEGARHVPLAVGFINLAGGYYYMRVDGQFFVLIKTADGAVVHENVYQSLEDFENQRYDVLSALEEGVEKRELTIEQGKFSSGLAFSFDKKVLLLLPAVGAFLALLYFMREPESLTAEPVASPPSAAPLPPQTPPPSQAVEVPQGDAQVQAQAQELKVGRLDLSCYEKFYSEALTEGKGSCEWSLNPTESESEVEFPPCERALKSLKVLGAKLQWGQVQEYGSLVGYSFSLAGPIYAQELQALKDLYFASLSLKLEGGVREITTTLSGVLICRRE